MSEQPSDAQQTLAHEAVREVAQARARIQKFLEVIGSCRSLNP